MQKIQNTIDTLIYTYDPTEFMPIFRDGSLANRNAFIAYKAGKLIKRLANNNLLIHS